MCLLVSVSVSLSGTLIIHLWMDRVILSSGHLSSVHFYYYYVQLLHFEILFSVCFNWYDFYWPVFKFTNIVF